MGKIIKLEDLKEDEKSRPIRLTFIARFLQKVSKGHSKACWPWLAHRREDGYGWFNYGISKKFTRCWLANRMAFLIANSSIVSGLHVLHTCDNPPCCNPAHLYQGTDADNRRDMIARGRALIGSASPLAILTERDVLDIRSRWKPRLVSQMTLSKEYGVTRSAIQAIIERRNWKQI